MDEMEFQNEKMKLIKTKEIIQEILIDEKKSFKRIFDNFIGSREDLLKIAERKQMHISNLEVSLDKPYFARIDFITEDDGKMNTVYIGKNGISKSSDIIVTDWRAPISSLYYDSEIGECSFAAPSGLIKGDLSLKRQYEINDGELEAYFDVDLVSQDSLLQNYLNSNNDARLKSIVSTIQKEQNSVIRKEIYDNIIIQGVAGWIYVNYLDTIFREFLIFGLLHI